MTLGQRIQEERRRLGLSQEALGEHCGVSRQAISKWESDAAIPEVEKLVVLGRLFGVNVGALLGVEAEEAVVEGQEAGPEPPPRKRRRPWLAAVFGAALLLAGMIVLGVSMGRLNDRLDELQSQIASVSARTQAQPTVDIAAQVRAALEEQNNLLSESHAVVADVDPDAKTVTLALSATPKRYAEGMTLAFSAAGPDFDSVTVPGALDGGQTFTAGLICPLSDEIRLSVVLTENGEGFSAPMETIYGAKRENTLQISAVWENRRVTVEVNMGAQAAKNGYPIAGEVRVLRDGAVEDSRPLPLDDFDSSEGSGAGADASADWTGGPTWLYVYFDHGCPEGADAEVWLKDSAGREYTVPVER